MRADRLLALVMLLQARGRMTAEQLAAELEVSVRTAYRDLDALGSAGIPIYTECGPHGGYELVEGYRTTLTGMTPGEVRALFMLGVPEPLAQLGMQDELRSALRKLAAALPTTRLEEEERVRQRFYLDATARFPGTEPVPHLQTVYRAVWENRLLYLRYRLVFGMQVERAVEPLGLVAKAGTWYLVCRTKGSEAAAAHRREAHAGNAIGMGQVRVQRVADLIEARIGDDRFERTQGFDLAAFWANWCIAYEMDRPSYLAVVRAAPRLLAELPRYFGERAPGILAQAGAPDADGWQQLTLPFETFDAARERILSLGGTIEVLKPEGLRYSVADFATQIRSVYERT